MESHTIDLLSPQPKVWSLECRVSRVWMAINPKTKNVLHMDLLVIDEKNNDIWVQIPKLLIPKFKNKLEEQTIYLLQNFKVLNASMPYRPVSNKLFIEFTASTVVQEIQHLNMIPHYKFSFIKVAEIDRKCDDRTILSDTTGLLAGHTETRFLNVGSRTALQKDINLQFDCGYVVRCSLWEELATKMDEIILANANKPLHLIVTSIYVAVNRGIHYFAATGATKIYVNLDDPSVVNVSLDRNNDGQNIILPKLIVAAPPIAAEPVSIAELDAKKLDQSNLDKHYIVECKVKDVKNGWFYFSCKNPKCFYKVETSGDKYYCWNCKLEMDTPSVRFRVKLDVHDSTGQSEFVLMDKEASKFFESQANTLYDPNEEYNLIPPASMLVKIVGRVLKFNIILTQKVMDNYTNQYTVAKIIDAEDTSSKHPNEAPGAQMPSGGSSSQSLTSCLSSNDVHPQCSLNVDEEVDGNVTGGAAEASVKKRKLIIMDEEPQEDQ